MQSLFQILRDKATSQETQIRHVLRFQSKTGDNINLYNLNIFSRLLPDALLPHLLYQQHIFCQLLLQ